ncbi:hypothetical protein ACTXGO_16205, partial [Psychrobacter sp. T6-1]|uniref:hypothetical protein n=1 Tax=Psychrobacter sp. T6-1 TaxID=3457447 RepID=UPI003FD33688
LPASSQHYANRLDWFSGDWTGYRTQTPIDNGEEQSMQLVVDDLRMMAGDTAFFSFVLANKDDDNQWQAMKPIDAPIVSDKNGPEVSRLELVKQGLIRVFDESVVDEDGWLLVDEK